MDYSWAIISRHLLEIFAAEPSQPQRHVLCQRRKCYTTQPWNLLHLQHGKSITTTTNDEEEQTERALWRASQVVWPAQTVDCISCLARLSDLIRHPPPCMFVLLLSVSCRSMSFRFFSFSSASSPKPLAYSPHPLSDPLIFHPSSTSGENSFSCYSTAAG